MVETAKTKAGRWPVVALLAVAGILMAAPHASAQSAVDQYVPQIENGGGSGAGSGSSSGGGSGGGTGTAAGAADQAKGGNPPAELATAESTDDGDDGGGTLPGSDFPLTGFVAALVAILVLGLLIRLAWPAIGRGLGSVRGG
jgi:hypothetical protein